MPVGADTRRSRCGCGQPSELNRIDTSSIVAFGHTHLLVDAQAPYGQDDPRRVFNTGSWVPQLDVTGLPRPTLNELDRVQYTGHELRFLAIELGDPPRARLLAV